MAQRAPDAGSGATPGLISVAETDFEEQMSELSEENQRLGAKLQDMERRLELKLHENQLLEAKLTAVERRLDVSSDGVQSQIHTIEHENAQLRAKVEMLERRFSLPP